MANIQKLAFELPNKEVSIQLIKLDKMIDTAKGIVADLSDMEGTDAKINSLISKAADYQLEKDAICARVNQTIVPQLVPEEYLHIKTDIVLQYESNQIIVIYDQDELDEYSASQTKESESEKAEPAEKVEGEVVEPVKGPVAVS